MPYRTIRTLFLLLGGVLLMAGLAGCGTQVERLEPEEVRDLSGAWNDTDSRLVSEEMISDMLSRPWVNDFKRQTGKQPVVIVGTVRNLSHEHINTNTFVNDIQRELTNSGRVTFVASRVERDEIRDERLDQDIHASAETRKAMGQEYGADYMLSGQINTIIDMEGRTQVRYYQVDLTLISLTDNRKAWVGQKKIKKEVVNSKLRY
ncbi:penicillin-binding protein activator LpoB [Thiohalophilus sp.]|uniref:penicillin-binding protein activator LpoB n=1 Tax=Thiohalophilus sp. TaxID=3028392 RepID=UPI002ACEF8F9|nr:penicillin-binding protein activator LpoB [Thiohalophilus sp.]MDZ7663673.1 penicillin-binding protein activator LpoB [Thiohalophilus sp.]